jgi:hypothetical protein
MGYRYSAVKKFQLDVLNRNTAHYHELLDVHEYLAEWILWGGEHLPDEVSGQGAADILSSTKTILVRLFNDFEAVKILALRGLPDQAYGSLRDSAECMMLCRLFTVEPKSALRWLSHLKEYSPGTVHARLSALGVATPEYAMYGYLSGRSHANLAGSIAAVSETDHGGGLISTHWGVGGFDNPIFIRLMLFQLCLFQLFAMVDPLRMLFDPHLAEDADEWKAAIREGIERMRTLVPEVDGEPVVRSRDLKVALDKIDSKVDDFKRKLLEAMKKALGAEFTLDDD